MTILRLPPLPESVAAAKQPRWRRDALQHRACPVCSEDAHAVICLRPDGLAVARCRCGMLYVPDVPSAADVARLYAQYNDHKPGSGFKRPRDSPLRRLLARFLPEQSAGANLAIQILEVTGGLAGRRLAEVGCLYGSFLQLARSRGASVLGVELDEDALRYLGSIGIPAAPALPPLPQDVVCAFNVLEHLVNPGEMLERMGAAIVPDGRLLLEVPNGTQAEHIGPAWIGFRVDLEHLNYFTQRSIADLLRPHGLWVEQCWEHNQPDVSRSEALPPRRGLVARVGARLKPANGPVDAAARRARSGTYALTVLARKVVNAP